MQTLEALTTRTTTLQSIKSVVRTMKTLSAVNAAPFEHAAASIEAYHATVLEGFHALVHSTVEMNRPLPVRPSPSKMALIFGTDHGLCGGYNETVAKAAQTTISRGGSWRILAIGARMEAALSDRGLAPDKIFLTPSSTDGIGRLASEVLIELDRARQSTARGEMEVTLFHMKNMPGGGLEPQEFQLLPLPSDFLTKLASRPWVSRSSPAALMDPQVLFSGLLRNLLYASTFRAAAHAIAAENTARYALMQQAEHAIDDRLSELKMTMRTARQSEITNELLDVIAGFETLKKSSS